MSSGEHLAHTQPPTEAEQQLTQAGQPASQPDRAAGSKEAIAQGMGLGGGQQQQQQHHHHHHHEPQTHGGLPHTGPVGGVGTIGDGRSPPMEANSIAPPPPPHSGLGGGLGAPGAGQGLGGGPPGLAGNAAAPFGIVPGSGGGAFDAPPITATSTTSAPLGGGGLGTSRAGEPAMVPVGAPSTIPPPGGLHPAASNAGHPVDPASAAPALQQPLHHHGHHQGTSSAVDPVVNLPPPTSALHQTPNALPVDPAMNAPGGATTAHPPTSTSAAAPLAGEAGINPAASAADTAPAGATTTGGEAAAARTETAGEGLRDEDAAEGAAGAAPAAAEGEGRDKVHLDIVDELDKKIAEKPEKDWGVVNPARESEEGGANDTGVLDGDDAHKTKKTKTDKDGVSKDAEGEKDHESLLDKAKHILHKK